MFLKSIVIGTGIRFWIVKGAVIDKYLSEIKSVYCVLKSIKLLILYVLALSAKNTRLLLLSTFWLLILDILDDRMTGLSSNISLSSCKRLTLARWDHSN